MKKGHQKFHPPVPYSIPFLSVLYQNKAFYNFRNKEGQRSIIERIIGLEYALQGIRNISFSGNFA